MSWQLYNDFFFYLFGGTASLQSLQDTPCPYDFVNGTQSLQHT
jgi:hypothetical protein